ncbi:MAG TPA: hypothetical protein VL334_05745, partial [Anaerolineae bacterium]|nr:hypothetical protein [Anaerolineae bacterium]
MQRPARALARQLEQAAIDAIRLGDLDGESTPRLEAQGSGLVGGQIVRGAGAAPAPPRHNTTP